MWLPEEEERATESKSKAALKAALQLAVNTQQNSRQQPGAAKNILTCLARVTRDRN